MSGRSSESGIRLQPVYRPADVRELDYENDLGDPGSYPYTRGRRLETDGGKWIHRELSGEGDPRRSNEQLKDLLSKGQTGLDVIGDAPTMALIDADHPFAEHSVGTQGVSLCTGADYTTLFDGLPLGEVSFSASLSPAFGIAGFYGAARAHGLDPKTLRGSVVNAPFFCEDCGYATQSPFELRLRLSADAIEFCSVEMPKFHSFLEDTYFISDGGLNAVEEMALGFVEIRYVVRELLRRGVDIDRFAPRIAILVNCSMDVFETVAKIRATRRLYARMMKEEFGAKDPRSMAVNIASHTSGLSLTAQQPINNVVRGTVQAMALAMAGVQAMEISTFDEAFRTPSAAAHEVGLRTQQIIALESNMSHVNDPLGGSYFIETLTDEMERRIDTMLHEIEAMGDPAALSDNGWFRKLFTDAMSRYARQIDDGSRPKVGLNVFRVPEAEDTLLRDESEAKIEPARQRVEELREYRAARDDSAWRESLRALHAAAGREGENLIRHLITAAECGATMGESSGVLREAYGAPYDPFGLLESPLAV